MPPIREVERLEPRSDEAQVQAAISACVAEQVQAGRSPEEAREMCETMIKEQMGGTAQPELPRL